MAGCVHLLHGQRAVRVGGDDRLALGGQQPLVGVQADAVHAHLGSLAQDTWMAPGRDRSLRDPSKTTTMSRPNLARPACRLARALCCRAAMMACSSAIRAATVSASLPISAAQFCPSAGRQCGSHRAHSQAAWPLASVRTQIWTSSRAVQRGDLGDQPPAGGPGHVAGSGDPHHASLGQGIR